MAVSQEDPLSVWAAYKLKKKKWYALFGHNDH